MELIGSRTYISRTPWQCWSGRFIYHTCRCWIKILEIKWECMITNEKWSPQPIFKGTSLKVKFPKHSVYAVWNELLLAAYEQKNNKLDLACKGPLGAGKMAPLVKCLPHKHEDVSSDPCHPHKSETCVYTSSSGMDRDGWLPGAQGPINPAMPCRFSERLFFSKASEWVREKERGQ